jgi:bifunctional pyridoxal-dependent enzyme with beta-cystathionase and maltose regulon repressor activities
MSPAGALLPPWLNNTSTITAKHTTKHIKQLDNPCSTPCFSTGVLLPRSELEAAAELCAAAGAWLVLDNTYEDFVYGGSSHSCLAGPNIINVFSFSKAYGMMG